LKGSESLKGWQLQLVEAKKIKRIKQHLIAFGGEWGILEPIEPINNSKARIERISSQF